MTVAVPNPAMASGYAFSPSAVVSPADIRSTMLANIEVEEGARKRPLDRENVEALKRSIKAQGLLQSIGVKRGAPGEKMKLVWGFHRFAAMHELCAEAEARGEQLAGAGSIAAVIFPADAPDWQIRAAEIAENLVRKELSADERAAHTLLYAAELKASGKCASVREAQKAGGKVGGAVAGKGRSKSGSQPAGGNPIDKPTTTQATATGLGITTNAVEKRVKAAAKAAGSTPVSIEKDTPEKLREVGAKALEKAHTRTGKATHRHAPLPRTAEQEEPVGERTASLIAELDQLENDIGIEGVKTALRAWLKERLIDPAFRNMKG